MFSKTIVIWPGIDPKIALIALDRYLELLYNEAYRQNKEYADSEVGFIINEQITAYVSQTNSCYHIAGEPTWQN